MLSNSTRYLSLRDFIYFLDKCNDLKRIQLPIDPYLEMTEIASRIIHISGPALLFENPKGYSMPVLCNLFGTSNRIAFSIGQQNITSFRNIGKLLAFLKEPELPQGFRDLLDKIPSFRQIFNMSTKRVKYAPCRELIYRFDEVDLTSFPIMHCWPKDAAPVITWGLTVTRGPYKTRQNIGVYRQQLLSKNKLIMRWLSHRGGALDFKEWIQCNPGQKFPVAVVLGADPATILSAVVPVPDTLSEYMLAGLFRGCSTEIIKCISCNLDVPANSEIVLEGYLDANEMATEGPAGDHTGYYNASDNFPVFTVTHITMRRGAIYHSTYSGRPPDEPSILGMVMNEMFIPILQKRFPEIVDFYLPPEGCSYRVAVVSIYKKYLGHGRQIMLNVWSFLRQFMYIKLIIVCDNDINARDWKDVIWAVSTRMDPMRDVLMIENMPIDYLDFSSPIAGLGSKIGIDATNKWLGETQRTWGVPITMDKMVCRYINSIWDQLGF